MPSFRFIIVNLGEEWPHAGSLYIENSIVNKIVFSIGVVFKTYLEMIATKLFPHLNFEDSNYILRKQLFLGSLKAKHIELEGYKAISNVTSLSVSLLLREYICSSCL